LAFYSGRKADHPSPSSAEVKEWVELYFHSPNTPSWHGTQEEHRDNFYLFYISALTEKRFSSVRIGLGYGLDVRCSRVRFPAGAGNFSLHHRVQNGCGAHPASYPMAMKQHKGLWRQNTLD
jgi:hypothetical protein